MDIQLAKTIETPYMKKTMPNVGVGDTINVSTIIRDDKGEKKRTQEYKGLVISMKNSGSRKTVTVRKISNGVGVEKIFPIHSPNVENIEIMKKGRVRRSKIYYMRDRIGKLAMKVSDSNEKVKDVQIIKEEVKEEKKEDKVEDAAETKKEKKIEDKVEAKKEEKDEKKAK